MASAIIGIAAEGVEEVVVRMAAKGDDILLVLVEGTGEVIAFLPHLVAGILLEETTEQGVVDVGEVVLGMMGVSLRFVTSMCLLLF